MTALETDEVISKPRLGATFHRSFSLVRSAVAQVLQIAQSPSESDDDEDCLTRSKVRALTHLGTIYVEAMPRYGFGTGLLDDHYCLTPLGTTVLEHDRLLEKLDTLWLMHYFLSAPDGPGPMNWYELVANWFRTANEFSSKDISADICDSFERTEGKPLAVNSADRTATAFLGTYTKDEALGRVAILEFVPATKRYRVLAPEPPSPWAFGYALLHYWHTQFRDQVTINLDELYREGGLGSIFLCGAGRVNRLLAELQAEGIVDVYRVAPPYQVVLLQSDPQVLLQKMYANHDTL